MTFQFALRHRRALEWALDQSLRWVDFLGVDEGFAEGFALDVAQPPGNRDWVGGSWKEATLYFASRSGADLARAEVRAACADLGSDAVSDVTAVEEQDWNAAWKAGFTGARVGPWHVVPPWQTPEPGAWPLVIEPGAGFGTGTHETTRMCLEAISELDLRGRRVLDFGSGSGVLSIAAAVRGARAIGVEIDPLAIENAHKNARLNRMELGGSVEFRKAFPRGETFDVVVANILKPVLLEFASDLVQSVVPGGILILSGLLREDAEPIYRRFVPDLGAEFRTRFCGDWIALTVAKAQRPDSRR